MQAGKRKNKHKVVTKVAEQANSGTAAAGAYDSVVSPLHDPYGRSETGYEQYPPPAAPYSAPPSQLPSSGHDNIGYGGVSTSVYDDFDEEDISGSSNVY